MAISGCEKTRNPLAIIAVLSHLSNDIFARQHEKTNLYGIVLLANNVFRLIDGLNLIIDGNSLFINCINLLVGGVNRLMKCML